MRATKLTFVEVKNIKMTFNSLNRVNESPYGGSQVITPMWFVVHFIEVWTCCSHCEKALSGIPCYPPHHSQAERNKKSPLAD